MWKGAGGDSGSLRLRTCGAAQLERQLQTELELTVTGPAAPDLPRRGEPEGVAICHNAAAAARVGRAVGKCRDIRVVHAVVALDPDLSGIALFELPEFLDCYIQIDVFRPGEKTSARVTQGSIGGRSQNSSLLHVASAVRAGKSGKRKVL